MPFNLVIPSLRKMEMARLSRHTPYLLIVLLKGSQGREGRRGQTLTSTVPILREGNNEIVALAL